MTIEAVSAKALAEWLGVSDRTVRDLADRGVVVRIDRGRYDLKASVCRYASHLREVAASRGGEDQLLDLTAERARLAKEQADGQAMKNAQLRGDLVAREDVLRGWQDILRKVRSGMLAVTSRVRQRISTIDAAQAAIIDREIRDALEALADGSDHDGDGAVESKTAAQT